MSLFLRSLLTAFILITATITSAQAEVCFWQHPGTKMSMTAPDSWHMVHNQKPDDILTFIGPSQEAFPVCRMRIRQDRRFLIFPYRYAKNIQHLYYSDDFWEAYAGEFLEGEVTLASDNAGLGRGRGSFAEIEFMPDAAPKVKRKAVAFVTLHRDKAYILECSAAHEFYMQWLPAFLSVAKSVEFKADIAQMPGGHYKPLHGARAIEIAGEREVDTYYGYGRVPEATSFSLWQDGWDLIWGLVPDALPTVSGLLVPTPF